MLNYVQIPSTSKSVTVHTHTHTGVDLGWGIAFIEVMKISFYGWYIRCFVPSSWWFTSFRKKKKIYLNNVLSISRKARYHWIYMNFCVSFFHIIWYLQLLSKLYMDTATLSWNGNQVDGRDGILKFYENLPTSSHCVDCIDAQPVNSKLTFIKRLSVILLCDGDHINCNLAHFV